MIACPLLLPREILVSRYLYKFWEGIFLNIGLDFGTLYLYAFWWPCCLVVDILLVGVGVQSQQDKLNTLCCLTLASPTQGSECERGPWRKLKEP